MKNKLISIAIILLVLVTGVFAIPMELTTNNVTSMYKTKTTSYIITDWTELKGNPITVELNPIPVIRKPVRIPESPQQLATASYTASWKKCIDVFNFNKCRIENRKNNARQIYYEAVMY